MLEKGRSSALPSHTEHQIQPQIHEEDLDFKVEAIVGKCGQGANLEYKVLWKGYPEEAASWEPHDHLECPSLIQEYKELVGEGASTSN